MINQITEIYSLFPEPSVETFDENGEKVAFNQMLEFTVGAGNFGGKKRSEVVVPVASHSPRNPDAFMEEKTSIDQVKVSRKS